jgi:hypothetical protein
MSMDEREPAAMLQRLECLEWAGRWRKVLAVGVRPGPP